MKKMSLRWWGLALALATTAAGARPAQSIEVTYQPYIQPGDAGPFGQKDQMVIAWQTDGASFDRYTVEYGRTLRYGSSVAPHSRTVNNYLNADPRLPRPTSAPQGRVNYQALLVGLDYDATYFYRVRGPGLPQAGFSASFQTRTRSGSFSFQVLGDQGFFYPKQDKKPYLAKFQARIANTMYRVPALSFGGLSRLPQPNLILNTGDNVYIRGSEGNYRDYWMPIWNSNTPSNEEGAPLARSIPIYTVLGNHDMGGGGDVVNLLADDVPSSPALPAVGQRFSGALEGGDALAYYNNFYLPLNGPVGVDPQQIFDGDRSRPEGFVFSMAGKTYQSATAIEAFRASTAVATAAGPKRQIDRMGNFSFDYGNAHFVFLDANPHLFNARVGASSGPASKAPPIDYSPYPKALGDWLAADLDRSKQLWKFVIYHQPAFSASSTRDYQMRAIAKLLEDHGVNLVFNGHVHNYQRTYPLRVFPGVTEVPGRTAEPVVIAHRQFDGNIQTVPDGLIHLVEGAGGFTNSGSDLEDSATGNQSVGGLMTPLGPDAWVDTRLTSTQMAPFVAGAGRGPKFTARFKARVLSFGNVVVTGNRLNFYQISEPLSATSSATATNPYPFGTDAEGRALNDPLPDPLIDPQTGALVTPPATGTPALIDRFSIARVDLSAQLVAQLSGPDAFATGQTVHYTVKVINRSPYALNGTQVVFRLPDAVAFVSCDEQAFTRQGQEVVVTLGRLEVQESRTVSIQGRARQRPGPRPRASATVRSSTALPVEATQVLTRQQHRGPSVLDGRPVRRAAQ